MKSSFRDEIQYIGELKGKNNILKIKGIFCLLMFGL